MIASLVFFVAVSRFVQQNEYRLVIVAGITIIIWLIVTFIAPSEKRETLTNFYRLVRPGGPGWGPVARDAPDVKPDRKLGVFVLIALIAAGIVYLTLPAIGFLIFKSYGKAILAFAGAGCCILLVLFLTKRIGWEKIIR